MKALVTGASGFLGRYIVEQLLARGDQVRGLCRSPATELAAIGVEVIRGDVRDAAVVESATKGIDTVFHVAGVAGIWGPRRHYFSTNVFGTQNVLWACRRQYVRKLIFTSSPSVTFDGADQCGIDESAAYAARWLNHYHHSKAVAEQMVLSSGGHDGVQTCALRPHLIWGPRDRQLVPRIWQRAREGKLRRVGDGTNSIDAVYVENAAAAHLQAADALEAGSPLAGKAYFIGQGEKINLWKWIDELLTLANLPPVQRSISTCAAWRIGAILEAAYRGLRIRREPPMTRFLAAQLGRSHWFDLAAAQRDFGYCPAVSTAEGMRRLKSSIQQER
ncbi:MAG: NAD-dependent epimerase/dehydratase family protein [Pirellulales bacterium]|nr:NAD-dependent epimerase/dehydratase family protein [Pirellulales bacterium]